MREAASCPFHTLDCPIRNHSLPTVRNATSHINRLNVSAITPNLLALLNTVAAALRLRKRRMPAHQQRTPVTISQRTIDPKKSSGITGEWMARHIPLFPGKVVSISKTWRTKERLELGSVMLLNTTSV